jgi:hypothetical protein
MACDALTCRVGMDGSYNSLPLKDSMLHPKRVISCAMIMYMLQTEQSSATSESARQGLSELYARLECNHSSRTVAAQSDPQQTRRRRSGGGQGAETGLSGRLARNTRDYVRR